MTKRQRIALGSLGVIFAIFGVGFITADSNLTVAGGIVMLVAGLVLEGAAAFVPNRPDARGR